MRARRPEAVLLNAEGVVCQHCGGPVEYRRWGDVVAYSDDDMLVTYRAVCVGHCPRFSETAEATAWPEGEYSVWESRY